MLIMGFNSFTYRTRRTPLRSVKSSQVMVITHASIGGFFTPGNSYKDPLNFDLLKLFIDYGGRVELLCESGSLRLYTQLSTQELYDMFEEDERLYNIPMHAPSDVLSTISVIRSLRQ